MTEGGETGGGGWGKSLDGRAGRRSSLDVVFSELHRRKIFRKRHMVQPGRSEVYLKKKKRQQEKVLTSAPADSKTMITRAVFSRGNEAVESKVKQRGGNLSALLASD